MDALEMIRPIEHASTLLGYLSADMDSVSKKHMLSLIKNTVQIDFEPNVSRYFSEI
jgi:hypothetical protein